MAVNPLSVEAEIKNFTYLSSFCKCICHLIFYHKISPRLLGKMTYYSTLMMIHNLFNSSFIFGILHLFQVFHYFKEGYVKHSYMFSYIFVIYLLRWNYWVEKFKNVNTLQIYFLERQYQFPIDICVRVFTLLHPQKHSVFHSLCEHILNAITV